MNGDSTMSVSTKASRHYLYWTVIVAMINGATAFAPSARNAFLTTSKAESFSLKTFASFDPNPRRAPRTALAISWPGKEDNNESEGKRDQNSSLKLVGEATSDLSLSNVITNFASPESIEELVAPVSKVLDDQTDGWALSYANLEPEDETTPIGISFLATNIAYGLAGSLLVAQGNVALGALTELACLASFGYHFSQLKLGQSGSRIVRLALLVDYVFAITAIIVGSVQLVLSQQLPMDAIYGGTLAVASLGACWVWEEGLTYIFFHSLWHLFSAYTGYVIGSTQ